MKHTTALLVTLSVFFTGLSFAQDGDLSAEAAALREMVAAVEAELEGASDKKKIGNITEDVLSPPKTSVESVRDSLSPSTLPSPPIPNNPVTVVKKAIKEKVPPAKALPRTELPKVPGAPVDAIDKALEQIDQIEPPKLLDDVSSDLTKKVEAADEIKKSGSEVKEVATKKVDAVTKVAPKTYTAPKVVKKAVTKPKVIKKVEKKAEEPVAIAKKTEEPAAAATPKKGKKLGEILFPKRGGIFKKRQNRE